MAFPVADVTKDRTMRNPAFRPQYLSYAMNLKTADWAGYDAWRLSAPDEDGDYYTPSLDASERVMDYETPSCPRCYQGYDVDLLEAEYEEGWINRNGWTATILAKWRCNICYETWTTDYDDKGDPTDYDHYDDDYDDYDYDYR
jgi:hypothetical protein